MCNRIPEPEEWRVKSWRSRGLDIMENDIHGVYSFWCHDNRKSMCFCIYVGKAEKQTIRQRLKGHRDRTHNDRLDNWLRGFGGYLKIAYASIDNPDEIDDIENFLIEMWRPITNKQKKLKKCRDGAHNERLDDWLRGFGGHLKTVYASIDNPDEIDDIESLLIETWRPIANKQKAER